VRGRWVYPGCLYRAVWQRRHPNLTPSGTSSMLPAQQGSQSGMMRRPHRRVSCRPYPGCLYRAVWQRLSAKSRQLGRPGASLPAPCRTGQGNEPHAGLLAPRLLPPPALRERRHRSLARRLVAVRAVEKNEKERGALVGRAFRRTDRRPVTRDRSRGRLRRHGRPLLLPIAMMLEAKGSNKSGARSFREGRFRPLG
jgi:hypothetical protein